MSAATTSPVPICERFSVKYGRAKAKKRGSANSQQGQELTLPFVASFRAILLKPTM